MRLSGINALNLEAFSIKEILHICKRYNCYAVCGDGKLIRFEPNKADCGAVWARGRSSAKSGPPT